MGAHESKRISSTHVERAVPSSAFPRWRQLRRSRKHSEFSSFESEAQLDREEELADCLASISLMALTGEGADLPKRGSVSSAAGGDERSRSFALSSAFPTAALGAESSRVFVSDMPLLHLANERPRRTRSVESSRSPSSEIDQSIANNSRLINDLRQGEDNDSSDWANMRSWMIWCLQTKLGNIETCTSEDNACEPDDILSVLDTSRDVGDEFKRSTRRHSRHLRRQHALPERSHIMIGPRQVLSRQQTSTDDGPCCSGQSSFESCGS